ncbi:MAG: TRAP transporter permease DctQ [Proteobacteria bacterium]|nr:MAG: TRAP transporter permease DctQ [Pseudomonadota bacterium]
MSMTNILKNFFDNFESYVCRFLLATFITLLFAQILSREFFQYSIPWGEELATYMFVWFAYFGASHATKKAAHNRVTFQFKLFPPIVATVSEFITDVIWLCFNLYFVYLSSDFVFNKMNLFWKSQTLGIPMKYIYMILPFAFLLMSIRIIQVNYLKFIGGVEFQDPDSDEMDRSAKMMLDGDHESQAAAKVKEG